MLFHVMLLSSNGSLIRHRRFLNGNGRLVRYRRFLNGYGDLIGHCWLLNGNLVGHRWLLDGNGHLVGHRWLLNVYGDLVSWLLEPYRNLVDGGRWDQELLRLLIVSGRREQLFLIVHGRQWCRTVRRLNRLRCDLESGRKRQAVLFLALKRETLRLAEANVRTGQRHRGNGTTDWSESHRLDQTNLARVDGRSVVGEAIASA